MKTYDGRFFDIEFTDTGINLHDIFWTYIYLPSLDRTLAFYFKRDSLVERSHRITTGQFYTRLLPGGSEDSENISLAAFKYQYPDHGEKVELAILEALL